MFGRHHLVAISCAPFGPHDEWELPAAWKDPRIRADYERLVTRVHARHEAVPIHLPADDGTASDWPAGIVIVQGRDATVPTDAEIASGLLVHTSVPASVGLDAWPSLEVVKPAIYLGLRIGVEHDPTRHRGSTDKAVERIMVEPQVHLAAVALLDHLHPDPATNAVLRWAARSFFLVAATRMTRIDTWDYLDRGRQHVERRAQNPEPYQANSHSASPAEPRTWAYSQIRSA